MATNTVLGLTGTEFTNAGGRQISSNTYEFSGFNWTRLDCFSENILDKKVHGLALNIFERVFNWIAMKLFSCYERRYQILMQKVTDLTANQNVHTLRSGTEIIDRTIDKIVSVITEKFYFSCPNPYNLEFIAFNGKKLYLSVIDQQQGHHYLDIDKNCSYVVENCLEETHLIRIKKYLPNHTQPEVIKVNLHEVFEKTITTPHFDNPSNPGVPLTRFPVHLTDDILALYSEDILNEKFFLQKIPAEQ